MSREDNILLDSYPNNAATRYGFADKEAVLWLTACSKKPFEMTLEEMKVYNDVIDLDCKKDKVNRVEKASLIIEARRRIASKIPKKIEPEILH